MSPDDFLSAAVRHARASDDEAKRRNIRKRVIAILLFENQFDATKQEYFADGIAEETIIGFSKFDWLTVIAWNSSFAFKGKVGDLWSVARDLSAA